MKSKSKIIIKEPDRLYHSLVAGRADGCCTPHVFIWAMGNLTIKVLNENLESSFLLNEYGLNY